MKNLFVWIILISTAAMGMAVAQPSGDDLAAMTVSKQHEYQA